MLMFNKLTAIPLRTKSTDVLLKRRYALSKIFYTSKYGTRIGVKGDENEVDIFDKPYKFSESRAATWPACYTQDFSKMPKYQGQVVSFSLFVFLVYFMHIREENDIDEKLVENMPIEVQEQIYGKKVK